MVKTQLVSKLLLLALFISVAGVLYAATPANTLITNQSTASYTNSLGDSQLVSSNAVKTVVQLVPAVDLEQTQSRNGLVSNAVTFPHLITNQGNGDDVFDLMAVDVGGDDFDFSVANINIYADTDSNGVADNTTVISSTPSLSAAQSYSFVVEVLVPATASDGDFGNITVTATSQALAAVSDVNTDTVDVIDDAIIVVSKSIGSSSGFPGSGPYTVSLSYENIGSAAASNITITDELPAGMSYAGNAVWSLASLVLTDANEEAQSASPSIVYCAYDVSCSNSNQVLITVSEVGAGQSGSVTFDVTIDVAAVPGVIYNTANYDYTQDDGSLVASSPSNTVPFSILSTYGVSFTGDSVPSVAPGVSVFLDNVITNDGDSGDTFNISLDMDSSTFPAGTGFFLYQADGVTPLTDTNGDGIADTGSMLAGSSTTITLGVTTSSSTGDGTYTIDTIANSLSAAAVSATATDSVTIVVPDLSVDLTNNFARGDTSCDEISDTCAFGAFNAVDPAVTVVAVDPGNTAQFTLFITNISAVSDSYNFSASTDSGFATIILPTGWVVSFEDTAGNIITNTGPLAPGQSFELIASVNIPALAAPQIATDIYFRVQSPVSSQSDVKRDAVTVNVFENITFTPNHSSTSSQNTFIVYKHTVTNEGNTVETLDAINSVNSLTWSTTLYEDTAGGTDDVWDGADQLLSTPIVLNPGDSWTVFNRVFVPSSAPSGQVNISTITLTYNTGLDTIIVTDSTTANPFDVDIVKEQALDQACDGLADVAFTPSSFSARPGECIVYRITVTNGSTIVANNVTIDDATPVFTVYSLTQPSPRCTPIDCVGMITQEPAALGSGLVKVSVGDMNPGDIIEFFFNVKVDDT